jgi:phage I-like protein
MTDDVATLAVWSTAFVNDLPDSAFLYIEPGGEKDEDGKTKPRSLRHFPYKDSTGAIDLPHLRNAIAQAPKSNLSEAIIKRVQSKGQKLLEKEREKMQKSSDDDATDGILTAEMLAEDTIALNFELPIGEEPPTQFQLFPRGWTRTTKGKLLFDEQSGSDVQAVLADHGKSELPVDYGHGMLSMVTTPDSGKAAAWFKPTTPNGELWAKDVQWTPAADKALRNREYRFFSPAVKFDRETRRVTQLINVALTNLHATKGLRPLVASETQIAPDGGAPEDTAIMSKLFEILGAKDETEALLYATEHTRWTKDVLAATEATSLDGALAGIAALKQSVADEKAGALKLAAQVSELAAKVDKSEKDEADRKKKALIAELSEAGKLPPALHKWAEGETIEQLTEFGKLAEPSDKVKPTTPKPPSSADPEITPQMKKLAAQMGVPIDEVKATLKLHAAETATD